MNEQFLFVYGTLMRSANSNTHRMLTEHADFVDAARIQGALYLLDGYPAAIVSAAADDWVHGELYRLRDPRRLLARLDRYEECGSEFPEPVEYVRGTVNVFLLSGQIVAAWIYLYNRSVETLPRIESGNFRRLGPA